MTDEQISCAILGASGYIGQHFARLLAEHPVFESPTLVATERSEGRRLSDVWQLAEAPPVALQDRRLVSRTAAALSRDGIRVAFSALPSGTAGPLESELVRRGVSVFSNAADHRMDAHVPLLVPEVNADHLQLVVSHPRPRSILVTNPNCSTTGLVLALAPVRGLLAPRSIHVATYQALSGAGYPGSPRCRSRTTWCRSSARKKRRSSGNRLASSADDGRGRSSPLPSRCWPTACALQRGKVTSRRSRSRPPAVRASRSSRMPGGRSTRSTTSVWRPLRALRSSFDPRPTGRSR